MKTEYTVYETATTTYNPTVGLKVGHPVAHYTDYSAMIRDWLDEFFAGTHNFMVDMAEN